MRLFRRTNPKSSVRQPQDPLEAFAFPEYVLDEHLSGLDLERLSFYQVEEDIKQGRMRTVPRCIGLAQGIQLSEAKLSSGAVAFGPCSISVASEATHIGFLTKATRSRSIGQWAVRSFPEVFEGYEGGCLLLDFRMSRTRSISKIIVGFTSETDAALFSEKFRESHFSTIFVDEDATTD